MLSQLPINQQNFADFGPPKIRSGNAKVCTFLLDLLDSIYTAVPAKKHMFYKVNMKWE